MKKIGIIAVGIILIAAGLFAFKMVVPALMEMGRQKSYVVGTQIELPDISEFYFTRSSTVNPPEFQRYVLSKKEGTWFFTHEKREGDKVFLTEEDVTITGTLQLTKQEQEEFFDLISGGTVGERTDTADSGRDGPFVYLFWSNDQGIYTEYTFQTSGQKRAFEEFCIRLKKKEMQKTS